MALGFLLGNWEDNWVFCGFRLRMTRGEDWGGWKMRLVKGVLSSRCPQGMGSWIKTSKSLKKVLGKTFPNFQQCKWKQGKENILQRYSERDRKETRGKEIFKGQEEKEEPQKKNKQKQLWPTSPFSCWHLYKFLPHGIVYSPQVSFQNENTCLSKILISPLWN